MPWLKLLFRVQAEWQACSSSPGLLSTKAASSVADSTQQSPGRVTRRSPRLSSPATSKTGSLQFTAVRFPPASRQPSLSTTVTGAAHGSNVVPNIDDAELMSAALGKKSKSTRGRRRITMPQSELHSTQARFQSPEQLDVADRVDDSSADISPELPMVSPLPHSTRTRTALKPRKVTSRQSEQGLKSSYTLRKRHSTADGGVQSQISVQSQARFLTPPRNTNKGSGSDVYEFHSEGHERQQMSCEAVCEAKPRSSDTSMFPLPPEITRVCANLEFLTSDSGKYTKGGTILHRLRSLSGEDSRVGRTTEKVSGLPTVSDVLQKSLSESESVVVTGMSKESGEMEQPPSSRLRNRSSESKSSIESGTGKDSGSLDKQSASSRRSRTRFGDQRPDEFEDEPVSSKDHPSSTINEAASAVSLTPLKSSLSSTTPTKVSSSSLQLGSQLECSQLKKCGSASPSPLKSDSICRTLDGTSIPMPSELKTSPQSSPVSLHGSPGRLGSEEAQQWRRASFRLLVNLRSPKSEHGRHSSTSSLEDADYWSDRLRRSMSPSSSSPSRSQQASSSRSRRSRPSRRDPLPSEHPTRRSLRLVGKDLDVKPSSTLPAKTVTVDTQSPR